MSFSQKKYIEKLEHRARVNPGNKTTYDRPFRGRSTVFRDKTKYDRARAKATLRKMYEV